MHLSQTSHRLFLVLTGLADGLAPKERRYERKRSIRPITDGSPASSGRKAEARLCGAGIQLSGKRRHPNSARG